MSITIEAQQKIAFDQAQREYALDANQSFIVQAPAGSGKTELLIQRFLILLTEVKRPEEILAITFTKKAANEMRARLIKALKVAATQPPPSSKHGLRTYNIARQVLAKDKKFAWLLLENPNQLRIQTIDSLCSFLTKQLPLLASFGAAPALTDNPQALYAQAVQAILTDLEQQQPWSAAITDLLKHLDNDLNKLHDLLINLLSKRDQWLNYLNVQADPLEVKHQLEANLQNIIIDALVEVKASFPTVLLNQLLPIARFAASELRLNQPNHDLCACEQLTTIPATTAENLPVWRALAQLVLTKSFAWRKQISKDIGFCALSSLKNPLEKRLHQQMRGELSDIINQLRDKEDLRLALTQLFLLPSLNYHPWQWQTLQSLLQVLKIVAAQLRIVFQQYNQIDFIENTQAALQALGDNEQPTDLALALDYQLQHILVDEFQDTSYSQYRLLEKLTAGWLPEDGRTLFVVGDPMQSIYRFREAEVGLFIRMRKTGIGNIKLIPITLAVNFRSQAAIIHWNNLVFKSIFPRQDNIAQGAVTYSSSVSPLADSSPTHHQAVNIHGFLEQEPSIQAQRIIEIIARTEHEHPEHNIAILVRSRTHLTSIIPALKEAAISYNAVDIDPLSTRTHIQDLISLTRAMLDPADKIAWLAVLRAPWCGLTLSDLWLLSQYANQLPLWHALNHREAIALSAEGRILIDRIWPILQQKIAEKARVPTRYWLESTWNLLGGPACLSFASELADCQQFFQLIAQLTLHGAALDVTKLRDKIQQLYAATPDPQAKVNIMTVHTSKGLEFDTVILPHLERTMPNDDKSLLLWMEKPLDDHQNALLLAPIHSTGEEKDAIYEYIQRQIKLKADYETNRLLYVATTRAKRRLHLLCNLSCDKDGDPKAEAGSFAKELLPFILPHIETTSAAALLNNSTDVTQEPQRLLKRFTLDWQNPFTIKPGSIAKHTSIKLALVDDGLRILGIVVHKVFQYLANNQLQTWLNLSWQHQEQFIQQLFKQEYCPVSDLQSLTAKALDLINKALNDKRGRWIFAPHIEAKSEWAITTYINNSYQNLVLDRTFIAEDDTRWIIDFKTTLFSAHELEDFLQQEQHKYAAKMQIYARALQQHDPTRPIKLGLYFPALPAWQAWDATINHDSLTEIAE